jgi:hypothetical protein
VKVFVLGKLSIFLVYIVLVGDTHPLLVPFASRNLRGCLKFYGFFFSSDKKMNLDFSSRALYGELVGSSIIAIFIGGI